MTTKTEHLAGLRNTHRAKQDEIDKANEARDYARVSQLQRELRAIGDEAVLFQQTNIAALDFERRALDIARQAEEAAALPKLRQVENPHPPRTTAHYLFAQMNGMEQPEPPKAA
ncbi:MAG: hypothetical protein SFV15_16815 [Polyangiaceae bacterium]|nr:hypothetical protein [Polyangiaceae bacterium]